MKKNEMTWQVMLIEAVGIVSAIAYLGLQIYYGIAFHVNPVNLMMNLDRKSTRLNSSHSRKSRMPSSA